MNLLIIVFVLPLVFTNEPAHDSGSAPPPMVTTSIMKQFLFQGSIENQIAAFCDCSSISEPQFCQLPYCTFDGKKCIDHPDKNENVSIMNSAMTFRKKQQVDWNNYKIQTFVSNRCYYTYSLVNNIWTATGCGPNIFQMGEDFYSCFNSSNDPNNVVCANQKITATGCLDINQESQCIGECIWQQNQCILPQTCLNNSEGTKCQFDSITDAYGNNQKCWFDSVKQQCFQIAYGHPSCTQFSDMKSCQLQYFFSSQGGWLYCYWDTVQKKCKDCTGFTYVEAHAEVETLNYRKIAFAIIMIFSLF